MVTNLKNTLSALLIENNMSFRWDAELKHWWLVRERPDNRNSRTEFFYASDISEAKQAAYCYLKLISSKTHPLR
jgi:hypothetical protein